LTELDDSAAHACGRIPWCVRPAYAMAGEDEEFNSGIVQGLVRTSMRA
jgi:hypothetical protein